MERITTCAQLAAFAKNAGLRSDWHEPDEHNVTAEVRGTALAFDNAGFWPAGEPHGYVGDPDRAELHVVLMRREETEDGEAVAGIDLAGVNLADLFAWAAGGCTDDRQYAPHGQARAMLGEAVISALRAASARERPARTALYGVRDLSAGMWQEILDLVLGRLAVLGYRLVETRPGE